MRKLIGSREESRPSCVLSEDAWHGHMKDKTGFGPPMQFAPPSSDICVELEAKGRIALISE